MLGVIVVFLQKGKCVLPAAKCVLPAAKCHAISNYAIKDHATMAHAIRARTQGSCNAHLVVMYAYTKARAPSSLATVQSSHH